MAREALLLWCAASALICGTAAVAATTLWRAPAPAPADAAPSRAFDLPPVAAPAPPAGLDFPSLSEGFIELSSVSFFSGGIETRSPFRGTMEVAAFAVPPVSADSSAGFREVRPQAQPSDARLSVRPPPRPGFAVAGLDPKADPSPAQSVPAIETAAPIPQASPGFDWGPILGTARPAAPERVIHSGVASWYGPGFHGRRTASGERFDQNDLTAAHRTLPFGTRVKVVDEKSGRSVVVRINDRGPFKHSRVIDLSKAAAEALGVGGLSRVKVVAAN